DFHSAMPYFGQQNYPWPPGVLTAGLSIPAGWTEGSVHFYLLPFLDQGNMMQAWVNAGCTASDGGQTVTVNPYFSTAESPPFARLPPPKIYLCPADPSGTSSIGMVLGTAFGDGPNSTGMPVTNYAVNYLVFGVPGPKVPFSFPDGASTTGMAFERYGKHNYSGMPTVGAVWPWGCPYGGTGLSPGTNVNANRPVAFWNSGLQQTDVAGLWNKFQHQPAKAAANGDAYTQSMHAPGMNVLMGDASVKSVAPSVTATTWSAAVTPDSNPKDIVGPDW